MTHRDQLLAIDPAATIDIQTSCGGSRVQIRWRAKGRSGVCEAADFPSAMADVFAAASAPARQFFNRGYFWGRK
jgi:hypothetical protein